MAELREPLLLGAQDTMASANYFRPVLRPESSPQSRSPLDFLTTMEDAENNTTVVQMGSPVKAAVPFHRNTACVAFGLENGTVGILDHQGDIRELGYHSQSVQAISSQGKMLATGSSDGLVRLWDLDTYNESKITINHSSPVRVVVITPDERFVLSASNDEKLQRTLVMLGSKDYLAGNSSPVLCLAVTANGDLVVTGAERGDVKLWRTSQENCVHKFTGHAGAVHCVAISPNDTLAVTGSADSSLKVWNIALHTEIGTLRGHQKAVLCCAVTPDRTRVVSGSEDTQVRVWSLESMQDEIVFTGHQTEVRQVYITSDSQYVISASLDVIVCSLAEPQQLACLRGHTSLITSVFLTSDYQYIVSTGLDSTIRVWGRPSSRAPTVHKPIVSYPSISAPAPIQYPEVAISQPIVYPEVFLAESSQSLTQEQAVVSTEPLPKAVNVTDYEETEPKAQSWEKSKEVWWGYKWSAIAVLVTLIICFFIITLD